MMIAVNEKQSTAEPVHHEKTCQASESGQKKLKTGSLFMPNVSEKKLVRMCAKEKNKLAKIRLLPACILRKRGRSIRKICEEPVIVFHSARLAGADAGMGIEGPIQPNARGQEKQDAQIIFQDDQGVAWQQAGKVRIRVRLLAAQLDTGDDPADVWAGLPPQGAHVAKDAQRSDSLTENPACSAQIRLQKRTRRVQGKGRQEGRRSGQ